MKRTTIFADEALLREVAELAQAEKRSVAEITREALQAYLDRKRPRRKKLSFVGIGKSRETDVAERHEELLWKKQAK